jgi:hypothetical protein
MHHVGEHDWEKFREQFILFGGIRWDREEVVKMAVRGNYWAKVMLGLPEGCICTLHPSVEGSGVERTPNATCPYHSAR